MKSVAGFIRKRKAIAVILGILVLAALVDFGIGKKEDAIIRARQAKRERLEKLANFMIFPDIFDAYAIKGKATHYEAIIKVDNVSDGPVYITPPQVRAYVQTGTLWTEIPVKDESASSADQVIKLEKGQARYKKIISIARNIKYTAYLMPLYMHVRFHISMFVLPESMFNEKEVYERYTDVYIYLKPYFIRNAQILKKVTFTDNNVPEMIPMPPH